MNRFSKKTVVFLTMLANAYRNEEEYETPIEKLSLSPNDDITEDITAMLTAMLMFYNNMCSANGEDMDLIGFTHLLNRLAIQFCYDRESQDDENEDQ